MRPRCTLLTCCLVAAALASGCANRPPTPDWQLNAHDSLQRATIAYLSGDARVDAIEFAKARAELARTGRADLVARAELTRCASRVAGLVFEACTSFAPLAADASSAERAYAGYLAGRVAAAEVDLLPAAQQPVAACLLGNAAPTPALEGIADPLSRLVAAGVLFEAGRADPAVVSLAVETASAQGWRRPLLAWLMVQAARAERASDTVEAARLRRRIELVSAQPSR
jgi:hypothetical protein